MFECSSLVFVKSWIFPETGIDIVGLQPLLAAFFSMSVTPVCGLLLFILTGIDIIRDKFVKDNKRLLFFGVGNGVVYVEVGGGR
jgi:hypothetical protein